MDWLCRCRRNVPPVCWLTILGLAGCGGGFGPRAAPSADSPHAVGSIWDHYQQMWPAAAADRNLIAAGWTNHGFRRGELLRAGLGEARTDRRGGFYCQRFLTADRNRRARAISGKLGPLEAGGRYTAELWYRMPTGQSFIMKIEQEGQPVTSGRFPAGDGQWKTAGLAFRARTRWATLMVMVPPGPAELLIDELTVDPMPAAGMSRALTNGGFERFVTEGLAALPAIRADSPPNVDGWPRERVWRQAPSGRLADDFGRPGRDQPATRFRVGWQDDRLMVFVECMEPLMQRIRRDVTARDADCEQDDCVELIVATDRNPDVCYRFVVTAGGVLADFVRRPAYSSRESVGSGAILQTDRSYTAQARWKVRRGSDRWSVELTVPAADLGVRRILAGRRWGVNVARVRHAGGRPQRYAWSPTGGDFSRTSRLGLIVFERAARISGKGPTGDSGE